MLFSIATKRIFNVFHHTSYKLFWQQKRELPVYLFQAAPYDQQYHMITEEFH